MHELKSLPRMALPLVISFTFRFLFSVVDLSFAALLEAHDNSAVAAIGLYAPFQFGFIAIWVGLSGGFTAALSQAFGRRDEARVRALGRAIRKVLGFLVPLLSLGGVALWFAVPLLQLEPALERSFRAYAATMLIGMPLTGFWAIYPDSIVKAHQDTRSTMIAGLVASITNVALSALFAFTLGWGLFGIALATVVSRIPSLAYAIHRARFLERGRLQHAWQPIAATWAPPLRSILRLAGPGAATFGLAAVESGIVNGLLKSAENATTAIAIYGVYDRLLLFALMPASATAVAVVPFLARALPTGDLRRIRQDMIRALGIVATIALAITVVLGYGLAEPVVGFLIKSEPGDQAAPGAIALVRYLPLSALALSPFLVLRPVFEAANEPARGVWVSLLRYLALSIPLVLLARYAAPRLGLGLLEALILAMICAATLAAAITAWLAAKTVRTAAAAHARRDNPSYPAPTNP